MFVPRVTSGCIHEYNAYVTLIFVDSRKLLYFVKGKKCSWHYHKLKDETFYIQSGRIRLRYSDDDEIAHAIEVILCPGDKFHIYRGLRHQMEALTDVELFEFSTEHFDEDSIRIERGD